MTAVNLDLFFYMYDNNDKNNITGLLEYTFYKDKFYINL